jgi:aminoacyl-tRNA hydrolase
LVKRIIRRFWPVLKVLAAYYRKSFLRRCRLTVVIGSLGKTTTTIAVKAALGIKDSRESVGNEGAFVALEVLRIPPWRKQAVIEVGLFSRGWMRGYAELLRPDVVVVTSIANEHNRSLGSLEDIRREKSKMLVRLKPEGLAVLNGDDENVLWMKSRTKARIITYGFSAHCDIQARDVKINWPQGTSFSLVIGEEFSREVSTKLTGRTFVYSALAAVAVARELGCSLVDSLSALAKLLPAPERLQPVKLCNGAYVLRDEFKSTPESVDVALDLLAEVPARRKIVVMGSLTDPVGKQRLVYRQFGARIAAVADLAVFIGRGTETQAYASGAVQAGMPRDRIRRVGQRWRESLKSLPSDLGEGDVILLKGRLGQRLGRVFLALDGREVGCELVYCTLYETIRCDDCKNLATGWANGRYLEASNDTLNPAIDDSTRHDPHESDIDGDSGSLSGVPATDSNRTVQAIVGLGNPGQAYKDTPHNVGQRAVDVLAQSLGGKWTQEVEAMVSCVKWHGQTLYLIKPVTNINYTGSVLSRLGQRFGLRPSGLILVHDDIDLPLGTVRQRMKGSSGGHRGVGSIIECFQTEALRRVKIGVGRPQRNIPAIEYVLSPFPPAAQPIIDRACAVASERILALVASGVESLAGVAP